MSGIRLYGRYVSLSLQSQMQYRASFVMFALANGLSALLEFFATAALFARFGSLRGWALPEVALFYGMVHTAFALAEAAGRGFDVFHLHVRNGTFDRMMLRPRSTVLQVLGQDFQLLRVGRFAQGLFVLLWGAASLGMRWTAESVFLAVLSVVGGALLFSGLFVLQATLSFWSVEGLEIANTLTYGGVEAAQFPLSIYRKWLREFFVFVVPIGCINYFPLIRILGRGDPLGYPGWAAWVSPAVGLGFFLVSLRVWGVGVRHYRSTGS
ncbi:MAG: ABC-2 family transporter protein [Bacillota bacterium]|nr:ABC-2 family transporter protein [Bacillota bacterium]